MENKPIVLLLYKDPTTLTSYCVGYYSTIEIAQTFIQSKTTQQYSFVETTLDDYAPTTWNQRERNIILERLDNEPNVF